MLHAHMLCLDTVNQHSLSVDRYGLFRPQGYPQKLMVSLQIHILEDLQRLCHIWGCLFGAFLLR